MSLQDLFVFKKVKLQHVT